MISLCNLLDSYILSDEGLSSFHSEVVYYPTYPDEETKAQGSESSLHRQKIQDLIHLCDYTFHT